jgi:hypothetical protein
MKNIKIAELGKGILGGGCGCDCNSSVSIGCGPSEGAQEVREELKVLNIDLVVIDLSTCKRCVPTGDQLREAVKLLTPAAEALGIELRHRETVVQTPDEARRFGLVTSPTIRINGRDIAQDIRESVCESCGDLTENNTIVDCREWHYKGKVYPAAPVAMLVESIMQALLQIDEMPPLETPPLLDLPENLKRYFANKKGGNLKGCCS